MKLRAHLALQFVHRFRVFLNTVEASRTRGFLRVFHTQCQRAAIGIGKGAHCFQCLAHERAGRGASTPDCLPALQEELMVVIAKYIHIDRESINVQLEKHGEYDVLELNITLPDKMRNNR